MQYDAVPPAAYILICIVCKLRRFLTTSLTCIRCAGLCELFKDPSTGKFTRIRLKMSTPLLQYRPRFDIINTLLHEAIHAYFFITTSWRHSRGDDGTGHGEGFQLLADAINSHGNYEVTVFHTFHDEVVSSVIIEYIYEPTLIENPPYRIATGRMFGNVLDLARIGRPTLVW